MAKISDEVLSEIISKTDIVDLISEKVNLSRKGKSYFGLCPFHNEKTPSFSVEPDKKIYKCFSCGEGGNAITFKQKMNNLSFVEAAKELAIRANMDISFSNYIHENPNKRLFDINKEVENFYKFYLSSTKQGKTAVDYLKERSIDQDIINAFNIGLAPTEYDVLYKTLTEKDILVTELADLGLVRKSKKDNWYDLFRERVIFPIHNEQGNTVGFSGRIYQNIKDDQPKYVNSPQTALFVKSNILYNLDKAINEIKKTNRVILYEGFMDVIASYRANMKEAVASMGTALTKEQVDIIKKYTNRVIICYDGDKPGIEAANRAIALLEARNLDVRVVILKDGLDPDDYINKYSIEDFQNEINNNQIDKLEFKYIYMKLSIDFTKMLEIEKFKKSVFDLIKNTSNTIIETYIKRLSYDIDVSNESVRQDFFQYTRKNIIPTKNRGTNELVIEDRYVKAERRILKYFMKDFKYLQRFNNEFSEVFYINKTVRTIKQKIENLYYKNLKNIKTYVFEIDIFYNELSDNEKVLYNKCFKDINYDINEFEDYMDAIHEYIEKDKLKRFKHRIELSESNEEKIRLGVEYHKRIAEVNHGKK